MNSIWAATEGAAQLTSDGVGSEAGHVTKILIYGLSLPPDGKRYHSGVYLKTQYLLCLCSEKMPVYMSNISLHKEYGLNYWKKMKWE